MRWGGAFNNAWNQATDAARAKATQVASGAQWVGKQSAAAKQWLADKAAQGFDAAKQVAKRTATAVKQAVQSAAAAAKGAAHRAAAAAKGKARDVMRTLADSAYDRVAAKVEKARKISKRLADGYRKAKQRFSAVKAALPTQQCPGHTKDGTSDIIRDGWVIVPQGKDEQGAYKHCLAVPPKKANLEELRRSAVKAPGKCCEDARNLRGRDRDIIYMNGIQNDQESHCITLNKIAEQTCGRVTGVYNATGGYKTTLGRLRDALQTGQDRRLIKAAAAGKMGLSGDGRNLAVDTLGRQIVDEVGKGNAPELWAHSQGAAGLSLALYEAGNALEIEGNRDALKDISVKSFGSAAPQWTKGPQYQHFAHINDPVPSLFGVGHRTQAAEVASQVIRFAGDPNAGKPFSTKYENDDLDLVPSAKKYHSVDSVYLEMENLENHGCGS